jgi:hypothetical protein
MATDFFQNFYTRDEVVNPNIITDLLSPCVNDDMNRNLYAPFSDKEISDASFSNRTSQSPGTRWIPGTFSPKN